MKYLVFILLIISMFFSVTCYAGNINVYINENIIDFDVLPVIQNDRTLVPMRKIFEELGCGVEWLSETQTIIATKDSEVIALQIGKSKIICTDIKTNMTNVIQIDTPPVIYNNRTLVPLRVISEMLGCYVEWDGETRSVIIQKR